jgi:cellulase/cellobiase CelA1
MGATNGPAGTKVIDVMLTSEKDSFNWSQGVCAAANVATTGSAKSTWNLDIDFPPLYFTPYDFAFLA